LLSSVKRPNGLELSGAASSYSVDIRARRRLQKDSIAGKMPYAHPRRRRSDAPSVHRSILLKHIQYGAGIGPASNGCIINSSVDSGNPSIAISSEGIFHVSWGEYIDDDSEIYIRHWIE